MGLAKNLAKILGGFLFGTFLMLSVLMIGLIDFTSYPNLKPFVSELLADTFSQQIDENQINLLYSSLLQNCIKKESIPFSLSNYEIKINCTELRSIKSQNLLPMLSASFFDSIYYRNYDCGFIQCLQSGPENLIVLISQKGNEFLKGIQIVLWALVGVGAVMLYASTDTLQNRLRIFGLNLTFSGASYFVLNYLMNLLVGSQNFAGFADVFGAVNEIFGRLTVYLAIILFVGISLIIASYMVATKDKTKKIKK